MLERVIETTQISNTLDAYLVDAFHAQKELDIFSLNPNLYANFLITGENGSGKTNFCALTAPFTKTVYVTIEAGDGNSLIKYLGGCGLLQLASIDEKTELTIKKHGKYNQVETTTNISYFQEIVANCKAIHARVVIFDSISAFYNFIEQQLPDTDIFGVRYNLEVGGLLARFRHFLTEILSVFNSAGISVVFTCPLNNKGELNLNGAKNKEFINGLTDYCYRIKELGEPVADLKEKPKKSIKTLEDAMAPVLFSVKDRGILRDIEPMSFLKSRVLEFDKESDGEIGFDVSKEFYSDTKNIKYGIYGLLLSKYAKEFKLKQNAKSLRDKLGLSDKK